MTTLVLWRHAATPYNASARLQGGLDIPLEADGIAQAERAAATLQARYGTPETLASSPLVRAAATAGALAALTGATVRLDDRLTQRSYGVWEGLTWTEVEREYPREYVQRMRNQDPQIAGWGTAADVAARVGEAIGEVAGASGVHVMVSHGSALSLGLLGALGLPLDSQAIGRLGHARWVELRWLASERWQLTSFNVGPG